MTRQQVVHESEEISWISLLDHQSNSLRNFVTKKIFTNYFTVSLPNWITPTLKCFYWFVYQFDKWTTITIIHFGFWFLIKFWRSLFWNHFFEIIVLKNNFSVNLIFESWFYDNTTSCSWIWKNFVNISFSSQVEVIWKFLEFIYQLVYTKNHTDTEMLNVAAILWLSALLFLPFQTLYTRHSHDTKPYTSTIPRSSF